MAELLRPDSNVTQSGFTGGFSAIDEATASDADFAYGANNTAAVLEVGLSNPSGTPGAGTRTFRYRHARTNNGTVDGGGNAVTVTAEVIEGTTVRATDAAQTATGTWTARSWTPDLSAVSNWNDLRMRFTTSASGGSPANRRGAAVSWAELEVPDPSAPPTDFTIPDMSAGVPALGVVALAAIHILSVGALDAGVPVLGAPQITQSHALSVPGFDAGVPVLGNPDLSETGGETALEPLSLDSGVPVLGDPSFGQVHALSVAVLETGVPILGSPSLGQVHALQVAGLVTGAVLLGHPSLGEPGGGYTVGQRRCRRLRINPGLGLSRR